MDEFLKGSYSAYSHLREMIGMFLEINDLKMENELMKETDPEAKEKIKTYYQGRYNSLKVVLNLIDDHIGDKTNAI